MQRRVAIILHGPPCTGKTTIAAELRRLFHAGFISLDNGWAPGEFRHRGGPSRYADLAQAPEPVLVVEIGCGEPFDLSFPGATRGASEWVNVLRTSAREIWPFLLTATWKDVLQRLDERHGGDPRKLFFFWQFTGLNVLYQLRHPTATFPEIPDFQEHEITTSGRTLREVIDEIKAFSGLR